MSASYKRQVFLSYNSADRPHVALVAQALATARIPFWWDDAAMGPGDEWLTRMNLPLKEAPAALIFLGSSGFGQTQEQEVQTFLRRRREEKTFVLIPVLLPGAPNEMPYEFLPNYLPVDLRGGDADIERLIAKLAELLTPADEPGPRPILPAATPGLDSVGTDGAASVRDERKRRREAVTSLFGKVYPSEGRNDAPEEPSIKSRRRVLGGAPRWRYLKHYYPRPNLLAEIRPQFDSFCSSESDREGWIPVFWLDGRSGDGKSILLLQLAEDIARRNPEALFIKLKTAHELPEAIRKLS